VQELKDQGSFFLSRLRYGVVIKDPETEGRIDLFGSGGLLEEKERVDMTVQIGEKTPVTVRLLGQRVPEDLASERRRKAKKDRHANANHSEDYMRWLGWNFLVTNVDRKIWTVEEAIAVYRLRWRIEIVFKVLKSCFEVAQKLEQRRMSAARTRMTIYGWLIYSALVVEPTARYFAARMARQGRTLSLLKYCRWLRVHYVEVLRSRTLAAFVERVARHCVYDKRKDRRTYYEQRQAVGTGKQRATKNLLDANATAVGIDDAGLGHVLPVDVGGLGSKATSGLQQALLLSPRWLANYKQPVQSVLVGIVGPLVEHCFDGGPPVSSLVAQLSAGAAAGIGMLPVGVEFVLAYVLSLLTSTPKTSRL